MIPAKTLTLKEFSKRYPPGGSADRSHGGRSWTDIQPCGQNVLNDIPANAKSWSTSSERSAEKIPILFLRERSFRNFELRSLQAVVKEISSGKSVFSHVLISPEDVFAIFGNDFMEEMEAVQRDASHTCVCLLTQKIISSGSFKKPFETYSHLNQIATATRATHLNRTES